MQIVGLQKVPVGQFDEVMQLLAIGEENRAYRATKIHEHSSRSHTIFRIHVRTVLNEHESLNSVINLVDLAGSERLSELGLSKQESASETAHINKSLFTLSHVISKLAENSNGSSSTKSKHPSHIPYRDSKLTRILQNSLGGNALTAIICTISPASLNFFQTLSTLKFASRAQIVTN